MTTRMLLATAGALLAGAGGAGPAAAEPGGCVDDFRPEGTDLSPADLDVLWVRLERNAVTPKGPDGAGAGSVLIRQYLGRWKGEVSDRMTCDEAEGARCRVEGRDEVTLVRQG